VRRVFELFSDLVGRVNLRLPCPPPRARQTGFTLIETIIAISIVASAVIAVVVVIGSSARSSSRGRESVTLLQLARAQVEAIQQYPFQIIPSAYPTISPIPEGFTVSFTSTDPGTSYKYPTQAPTVVSGSIQQITVTASGDYGTLQLTFYKIKAP
jgi:Tfp pilus assembly protein PilV